MASDPADLLRTAASDEAPPPAPLAGTRSQSMQRLQVGLFGLGAMVLLVGLANIIMTNARENEAKVVAEAAQAEQGEEPAAPVRDPLADAGVVPDMPAAPDEGAEAPEGNARPQTQP